MINPVVSSHVHTHWKGGQPSQNRDAIATPIQYLHSLIAPLASITQKKWSERAITYLNDIEKRLDERIPNFPLQNKLDQLGRTLEAQFAPLKKFNAWLDCNGEGEWYRQLANFLVKLPARAVRNIVRLLYSIIEGLAYAAVHPLKACTNLAKMLVCFKCSCSFFAYSSKWLAQNG